MKKSLILIALSLLLIGNLHATTIDLYGSDYLQSFLVTNDSGYTLTGVVYSFGTAADGIATWDTQTGGGVASDFLSNPRWFQTVTWSGLSIASGATFSIPSFSLDIDLIADLSPLSIDEQILSVPGLANAFFGVQYNDGMGLHTVALNQTLWTVNQRLTIEGASAVPEPSCFLLLGAGLIGLAGYGRKKLS